MSVIELVLLIFGGVVFTVSFFLPSGKKEDMEGLRSSSEAQIKEMVGKEVAGAKSQISEIVNETITYSMEKTERTMERLSNEKIMAVNEYSDTVLEQINKNHNEVVFLYDMLNDKHESLKKTAGEVTRIAADVTKTAQAAQAAIREANEQGQKEALEPAKGGTKQRYNSIVDVKAEPEDKGMESFVPISLQKIETVRIPETAARESKDSPAKKDSAAEPEKTVKTRKRTSRKPKAETEKAKDSFVKEIEEKEQPPARTGEKEQSSAGTGAGQEQGILERSGRNRNDMILELHKMGKSNMAIARELSVGVGEVKLVIDLFKQT